MAFLDKKGLARLWANVLSLVDKVVPQKVKEVFDTEEFVFDCGTAPTTSENLEGDGQVTL